MAGEVRWGSDERVSMGRGEEGRWRLGNRNQDSDPESQQASLVFDGHLPSPQDTRDSYARRRFITTIKSLVGL
jgi:hypothetical protein